ncbi:uncharacterized protein ABDE67_007547 [Symphorus nematophorus]
MWRTAVDRQKGTAALYFGLVLSHLVGGKVGGSAEVRVFCQPGQSVTLPCSYHYEDDAHVSQLSVQWRSPDNELLCHYIKHKAFQNCTMGYSISYTPGSITLSIQRVRTQDFGAHVCSVSKRHEFSDFSVELVRTSDSVTSAPNTGWSQSGPAWSLLLLHTLGLFVSM